MSIVITKQNVPKESIKNKWISRLVELAQDWRFMSRQQGWQSMLPIISHEIAPLPYRHAKFAIVARSLLEPIPDPQPRIDLKIRPFRLADVEAVSQIDRPSHARLCQKRLLRGHEGLVAIHQGQVVGYAWGCDEFDSPLERIKLDAKPGDMLCVDVYTAAPFRKKGIHTALTLARFQQFKDLGYERAIAYIETSNHPSLATWQKINSEIVGHVDFRRIGIWRRVTIDRQDLP